MSISSIVKSVTSTVSRAASAVGRALTIPMATSSKSSSSMTTTPSKSTTPTASKPVSISPITSISTPKTSSLTNKTVTATPIPSPVKTISSSGSSKSLTQQISEFNKAGLQRVAAVLNPFDTSRIIFTPTGTDVTTGIRITTTAAEIGSVVYGGALVGSALGLGTTGGAATAGSTAIVGGGAVATSKLLTAGLIGAAAGYTVSSLADTGKPQVQSGTQNQTSFQQTLTKTITIAPVTTYTIGGSTRTTTNQYTTYLIQDSPYAQIGGSPSVSQPTTQTQDPYVSPIVSPVVSVDPYLKAGQGLDQAQTASSGVSWITIALIGLGAYALTQRGSN